MTLGQRINELRRAKGITHAQLAELAGISRSYVTRLQANRVELPSKRVLWSLAHALATTPDDLLAAAGFLPSRDRTLRDPGLEIAFRYVASLPEDAQHEVLDFVAGVSLNRELHSGGQRNGEKLDRSSENSDRSVGTAVAHEDQRRSVARWRLLAHILSLKLASLSVRSPAAHLTGLHKRAISTSGVSGMIPAVSPTPVVTPTRS